METIRGKTSVDLDLNEFKNRLKNYNRIILDLGTGDGKFAFHYAEKFPTNFVIGLDSCRENLQEYSREKLPNLLYVIANAQSLPYELSGMISHISINFPWGSLLAGLLIGGSNLMCELESITQPNTTIDIRLNGGAMSEMGICLEAGASQIQEKMREVGWQIKNPSLMKISDLKKFPSTWSRRIAVGRDPRAISLSGCK
jgi:16S rRNA (adenine(1408)-N(1))-methyltransferase